jgi:DeoR family fructose operon transcriptional repressor
MSGEGHMIAEQRRRTIGELATERGSIRVSELTQMFNVDETTIRRDLAHLAGHGILKRSHGGAVVPLDAQEPKVRYESVFSSRLLERAEEKRAIGARAAELVKDGSTIAIDAGTTAVYVARALRGKQDLVVVTNAITTAIELVDDKGITLVLTGGVVRPLSGGATGDLALITMKELRVDQAFITTHSVSLQGGLSEPSFDEVAIKRAMIGAASEVILITDHSKFDHEALVRTAPLSAIDHIITSEGIDPKLAAAIRETGVRISIVGWDTEHPHSDRAPSVSTGGD